MTREEFFILNRAYDIRSGKGRISCELFPGRPGEEAEISGRLAEEGLLDGRTGEITEAGVSALEPFRVSNAVILAAGPSTRFIPLSLERPKGLFEVKGERLIDRQIEQLREAGIEDVTVVLGYKKEMFFYLKEKYGVRFVFNSVYNRKNNIESLCLAKEELNNTYVCSCDNYFVENPFHQYEYQSFYAGFFMPARTGEMYVLPDGEDRIVKMQKGLAEGYVLMGHSFWKREFCEAFLSCAETYRETGIYDHAFWEWLVRDHLDGLPPIYLKKYAEDSIFEFDYFEELRAFDEEYVRHAHSEIIGNIKSVFRCEEADIVDFRNVEEGMTNTSFIFRVRGADYVYRHPGEGTGSIINRKNEKRSLEIARELGIDTTYVHMDEEAGWKISGFVPRFREPDYRDFGDSKKIIAVLRALHAAPVVVDYGLRPWQDAAVMEELLVKKDPDCFKEFLSLKKKVGLLHEKTAGDGVEACFCHGDTYKPNWMIEPDGCVLLIDWEYSGYSDPGIDVGYYIVDAMYDFGEARAFIREYLGGEWSARKEFHFMAYVAIIAYYWFVWAMYRESCGAIMGEALFHWYEMAGRYADYLIGESFMD